MKISGIYKIQSIIKPERVYIGSSVNINKRWGQHIGDLRNNKHCSKTLQRHFNKYNENDLQFSILLGCKNEDLLKTEQYFLDSYNVYFNTCKIAGSQLGFRHTAEGLKNISIGHMGQVAWNKGIKNCYSTEACKKISDTLTGKKQSQETINKRILKIKKTWELKRINNEHHAKTPPWNKNKTGVFSESALQKIRDARKNQVFLQESQDKKRDSMKKTIALKKLNALYLN